MNGIVADLIAGPHGQNGLAGHLERSTKPSVACGACGIARIPLYRFVGQKCRQPLPDELRN
jgi:hypothetical protein